jgi:hypothetical protein
MRKAGPEARLFVESKLHGPSKVTSTLNSDSILSQQRALNDTCRNLACSGDTMGGFAKLLTSVAALVAAIAWPVTVFSIVYVFRAELRSALNKVPVLLERLKKAALLGLSLELDRVADAEAENGANKTGNVTPRQIEAAARIAVQTREVDPQTLLKELDRLCLEYDSLRRSLPSGAERTRAMTRLVVKMRSLAPSLLDFLDIYKSSGSAGSRLAAIAMMQMAPQSADLAWLKERFSTEHPFVFYHAALALQNIANVCDTPEKKKHLREVAQQALATLKAFTGPPDRNTVEILEMLLSSLPER